MNRKDIIQKAINECYREMYAKAQPAADFDALIEGKKNGTVEDSAENPIFQRYYLSQAEFMYIRDKYMTAYRFVNDWKSNIEFLKECLKDGGYRDAYKEQENGEKYRCAEPTEHLDDLIGSENAEKVFKLISDLESFYRFDRDEETFSCAIALGCSPTSNLKEVEEYWRNHGMPDFKIEERDPETFWYRDEFGDEWEEIYKEEMESINEEESE